MSGLPARAQWTAACRSAADVAGTWHRAGDGGPFWVIAPVYTGPEVPVTVHGHAGDVAATVNESALRHRALRQLVERDGEDLPRGAAHAVVGHAVRQYERGDLHSRTHHGWVARWTAEWEGLAWDPEEHPDLTPGLLIADWRATRWRGQLLLIVWGGQAAARTIAPHGTMTVDVGRDCAGVAVHDARTWDRVTAALLEAAASGGDLLEAAANATRSEADVDG